MWSLVTFQSGQWLEIFGTYLTNISLFFVVVVKLFMLVQFIYGLECHGAQITCERSQACVLYFVCVKVWNFLERFFTFRTFMWSFIIVTKDMFVEITNTCECLFTVWTSNWGFPLNLKYSLMWFASCFCFERLSTEKTTEWILIRMSRFVYHHMFKTFKSLATKFTYKRPVHDLSLIVQFLCQKEQLNVTFDCSEGETFFIGQGETGQSHDISVDFFFYLGCAFTFMKLPNMILFRQCGPIETADG